MLIWSLVEILAAFIKQKILFFQLKDYVLSERGLPSCLSNSIKKFLLLNPITVKKKYYNDSFSKVEVKRTENTAKYLLIYSKFLMIFYPHSSPLPIPNKFFTVFNILISMKIIENQGIPLKKKKKKKITHTIKFIAAIFIARVKYLDKAPHLIQAVTTVTLVRQKTVLTQQPNGPSLATNKGRHIHQACSVDLSTRCRVPPSI